MSSRQEHQQRELQPNQLYYNPNMSANKETAARVLHTARTHIHSNVLLESAVQAQNRLFNNQEFCKPLLNSVGSLKPVVGGVFLPVKSAIAIDQGFLFCLNFRQLVYQSTCVQCYGRQRDSIRKMYNSISQRGMCCGTREVHQTFPRTWIQNSSNCPCFRLMLSKQPVAYQFGTSR